VVAAAWVAAAAWAVAAVENAVAEMKEPVMTATPKQPKKLQIYGENSICQKTLNRFVNYRQAIEGLNYISLNGKGVW
jgi:hypothetical protein